MISLRSIAASVAVGGAILVAAACGGGDDSGNGAAEPGTTAATTAAETTETTAETAGTLTGTVGPGFTITLTQDGAAVESLAPGTYEFVISDESDAHNFHLTGPGIDEATDVGGTGSATWVLTLEAGEYTFVCDPHASSMNGAFTVA